MRFTQHALTRPIGVACIAALLALQTPRARAEEKLSYKYQLYREDNNRMEIQVNAAALDSDLDATGKLKLRLHGVIDAIAGATPSGEPPPSPGAPVVLSHMHDRRKAWDATFTDALKPATVSLGFANSRESDYVSNGLSLNTQIDLDKGDTFLLLGASGTRDHVKVYFQQPWLNKRSEDGIIGISTLVDPLTSFTFNLGYGRDNGYLADPYRLVLKNTEIVPGLSLPLTFNENRPSERQKWTAFAKLDRAIPRLKGSVELSARLYRDSWGIRSGTLTASWFQNLGDHFILQPYARYYRQSAADFYHVSLDGTTIVPTTIPTLSAPYYSADYRLSRLQTRSLGLKLVWTPTDRLEFDVSYERYIMEGLDAVTSSSAYPKAGITTAGLSISW